MSIKGIFSEGFIERLTDVFDPTMLEYVKGSDSLYGGLIVGLVFGIVLQKGRMCKYDVVSGLFRLQDFTVFRLGTPMLMVGMVFIYLYKDLGVIELVIPKTVVIPQVVGGLLFGAAIAILGYCPGTAAGAIGEGMLDAIPGILGMITGSVIFAEFFYSDWANTFLKVGYIGPITFPDLLGVNHWFVIILFLMMTSMFLIMVTMWDWMVVLFKKSLNYFMDFTDSLEEKLKKE